LGLTGQKTISGAENLGQIDPGYNDVADAMSLPAPHAGTDRLFGIDRDAAPGRSRR
jgi:hypothetical protein